MRIRYEWIGLVIQEPVDVGADADDNGKVDLTDPVYVLLFLFRGGDEILPPYPRRGRDPTRDSLSCD